MKTETSSPHHFREMLDFSVLPFLIVLFLASCFPGFPEPDCGGIRNVKVIGVVTDDSSSPIVNAIIHIESQKQNACTGSEPMPDFRLVSDDTGAFSGTIPLIYADDVIRIEVSADGFETHSYYDRTYTFFDKAIKVVLRYLNSASP